RRGRAPLMRQPHRNRVPRADDTSRAADQHGSMFFTYIWRELRRRMRQAVLIALGLALGVGLVITVTAASNGVKDSQATVLHTLYGVGTDITVTQPPAKGSGGGTSFGFRQEIKNVRSGQIAAGTKIDINQLVNTQYGTMSSGSLPGWPSSAACRPRPADWRSPTSP